MTDDFSPLDPSKHWLDWLGPSPSQAVRSEIESMLRKQVASAVLDWVRLLGAPKYLTGGRKDPEDENKLIVTRTAIAVQFELQVSSPNRVDRLYGVFSWVASGLDSKRRDRMYLDLDTELSAAEELLMSRIYELDLSEDSE